MVRWLEYQELLFRHLKNIKQVEIYKFANKIMLAKRVWLIANGGSLATCSHWAEDLLKFGGIKAVALTDPALITMSANDFGYEKSFSIGLERLVDKNDALIGISVSGESKNIIEPFKYLACKTLALVGVKNSTLHELADYSIVVGSPDFTLVEDAHLIIAHQIVAEIHRRKELQNG